MLRKIMNIQLLYYSGAGNTKFITNIIEKSLIKKNHNVKSIRITENSIMSLENDFDVLYLGFPIIFRDAPKLVYKVLEKLPGKNRPIMIFSTKGLYSGNAFKYIHKKSLNNNYIPIGFINLLMPGTDLLTSVVKENSFSEKLFTKIYNRNIVKKINKFIEKMEKNKPIKKVYTKWYTIFDNLIVKKIEIKVDNDHKDWIKDFTVNNEKCNQCMKCINGCPRNNINLKNGITFEMNCDVCLFCINNCPNHAINISDKTVGKLKYSEEKIQTIFKYELEKQNGI